MTTYIQSLQEVVEEEPVLDADAQETEDLITTIKTMTGKPCLKVLHCYPT